VADLKLMIERLSEREKNSMNNQLTDAERKAELEIKRAEVDAEQTLAEQKEQITNDLKYEYEMKENTQDVTYRNAILREKQRVIQKAFKDAENKLNKISSEDFMQLVVTALDNVDVTKTVELYVGEKSEGLMDKEWLNQYLPWNNHVAVQEETVKNKGGVLVRVDNIDYNYFFDELIDENRYDLLAYVTNQLFSE
jgi:V/A-type H+-transporting ATPase subunit E